MARKKYNTFAGAKPGSGKNFSKLEASLAGRPGVTNPGGLAAWIGRRKYGPRFGNWTHGLHHRH